VGIVIACKPGFGSNWNTQDYGVGVYFFQQPYIMHPARITFNASIDRYFDHPCKTSTNSITPVSDIF
jgi:hypothetical protein